MKTVILFVIICDDIFKNSCRLEGFEENLKLDDCTKMVYIFEEKEIDSPCVSEYKQKMKLHDGKTQV